MKFEDRNSAITNAMIDKMKEIMKAEQEHVVKMTISGEEIKSPGFNFDPNTGAMTINDSRISGVAVNGMTVGALDMKVGPTNFAVDNLTFIDQNGVNVSMRDMYRRFTYIETQEMTRMSLGSSPGSTSSSPPVFREEYEAKIRFLETENRRLEDSLKQVSHLLVERMAKIEQDLADRPQTSPTW